MPHFVLRARQERSVREVAALLRAGRVRAHGHSIDLFFFCARVVRIMMKMRAAALLLQRAGLAGVAACARLTPGTLAFLVSAR